MTFPTVYKLKMLKKNEMILTFSPGSSLVTEFIETVVPKDTDNVSLWRFAFDLAKTT